MGYWEAVAPLSIWVKFIKHCVVKRLHYEPDPEHVGTSESDAPRSQLVPGVGDFKNGGLEMIMMTLMMTMMIDDAQTLKPFFLLCTVSFKM